MMSPVMPYTVGAVATSSVVAAAGAQQIPWTEGTIATAVIAVSMFWIRRADADARRERTEMRNALHRQNRMIAALVKGFTEMGLPLPDEYSDILDELEGPNT